MLPSAFSSNKPSTDATVSVIIPVYNNEAYLDRCISSLQAQTFKNWTAIFVNDGSKDNSQTILEKYAAEDSRIQLINKPNGGAASARNAGLDAACTEYITMVDADDAITPDALERLLTAATETKCDIVVAACAVYGSNGSVSGDCRNISGFMPAVPRALFRNVYRGPVAKLYRRDIIERYHLRMPEDMTLAEDYVFVTSYWTRCKTAYAISEPLYHYYYSGNENSLVHRFCRRELPFEAYRLNAEAAWHTFRFLTANEKDKNVISAWTYELYRDLWKMSNNSCRYLCKEHERAQIRKERQSHDKEMRKYVSFFSYIFMPHRHPKLASLLMQIKHALKRR
ncbi:MAG: glycosyltransferase family 2 protein [Akkermansia sp.]|nr:glycosyltransferase family 2 protein [Akkermansia sp.]